MSILDSKNVLRWPQQVLLKILLQACQKTYLNTVGCLMLLEFMSIYLFMHDLGEVLAKQFECLGAQSLLEWSWTGLG